jgi:hypothetical protein
LWPVAPGAFFVVVLGSLLHPSHVCKALILLSAVWMNVPTSEQTIALNTS